MEMEILNMGVEEMRCLPRPPYADDDVRINLEVLVAGPWTTHDALLKGVQSLAPEISGEQDYSFRDDDERPWLVCLPCNDYDRALSWVATLKAAGLDAKIEVVKYLD
jgi:hypothetical protein